MNKSNYDVFNACFKITYCFSGKKSGIEKKEKDQPGNGRSVIFWFMIHLEEPGLGVFSQEKDSMYRQRVIPPNLQIYR